MHLTINIKTPNIKLPKLPTFNQPVLLEPAINAAGYATGYISGTFSKAITKAKQLNPITVTITK